MIPMPQLLLSSPHVPPPLAAGPQRHPLRRTCRASAGSRQWPGSSSEGGHGFTSSSSHSSQHPRPHHAQHAKLAAANLGATASAANSALQQLQQQLPKLAVLLTSHRHRRRRWAAITRRVNADRATQLLVQASVAPALVLALQPLVHPAPLACWQVCVALRSFDAGWFAGCTG
jgi:hypothetical protein